MALVPHGTARISVGKQPKCHPIPQDEINALLVNLTRARRRVVRLKGGDAFVFGRGGEELEHLRAHGIPYEVVPGITAALGCAAYAGIPLTHRDHAQQLTLATAHGAGDESSLAGLNLPPGGKGRTLVLYMGVRQAVRAREQLLAQGMTSATPAALVVDGTMDRQRVLYGTVSKLPALAARVPEGAPGLFIIGEVAALGEQLAWFGNKRAFERAA
ncbi:MAG: uroporphyrinogen-III C-methyltransferase, partial [Xanthomonadales bacterium]|nr:uroporphyrinogen-III C-methyltransferase [Xanthomonadales bacterium]